MGDSLDELPALSQVLREKVHLELKAKAPKGGDLPLKELGLQLQACEPAREHQTPEGGLPGLAVGADVVFQGVPQVRPPRPPTGRPGA